MDLQAKINLVRSPKRPESHEIIEALFTDFVEMHGDRVLGDDASLTGGVAFFQGQPVTVIGVNRGRTLQERLAMNFGAVRVTGYRKALRLIHQAEKFHRPVITLINMPGADVSLASEDHGQSLAIAEMIDAMGELTVPNIAVIIGEGHSGGALAFANVNRLVMFEHALFSVASPEVVSAILKKVDSTVSLNEVLPMTADKLAEMGLVDAIVSEAGDEMANLTKVISDQLAPLKQLSADELIDQREKKYEAVLSTWGK